MSPTAMSIGDRLREARIQRALSIEETAWRTRIRPEMLIALEREDFSSIGHQAFVRSHLVSYARFLGLDPALVVDEFVSRHESPEPSSLEQLHEQQQRARKPPRAKWVIAAVLSTGILLGAASTGLLGGQAEPSGPLIEGTRPGDRASRSDVDGRPLPVPVEEARVRLVLEIVENTEGSISVDGTQVFEGNLRAGTQRVVFARETVDLLVANGGAVRLRLNGRTLGVLGDAGAVARARFGPSGPTRI